MLDEVQFVISDKEVKGKEPIRLYGILNGLLRLENVDIYITGSNSKFLSSDIMTEFRGRGDEIRVYPLSFKEFYSSGLFENKYEAYEEYCAYGGLPMILNKKTSSEKSAYLKDLLTKTYVNDVIERNNLKGDIVIDNLVDILASSIGSLTNPLKLSNTFKSDWLFCIAKRVMLETVVVSWLVVRLLVSKLTSGLLFIIFIHLLFISFP